MSPTVGGIIEPRGDASSMSRAGRSSPTAFPCPTRHGSTTANSGCSRRGPGTWVSSISPPGNSSVSRSARGSCGASRLPGRLPWWACPNTATIEPSAIWRSAERSRKNPPSLGAGSWSSTPGPAIPFTGCGSRVWSASCTTWSCFRGRDDRWRSASSATRSAASSMWGRWAPCEIEHLTTQGENELRRPRIAHLDVVQNAIDRGRRNAQMQEIDRKLVDGELAVDHHPGLDLTEVARQYIATWRQCYVHVLHWENLGEPDLSRDGIPVELGDTEPKLDHLYTRSVELGPREIRERKFQVARPSVLDVRDGAAAHDDSILARDRR